MAHLASQTRGRFQDPSFQNSDFGIDNLGEVFHEVRALPAATPGQPQYLAVDFASFLTRGTPPRGLFQLEIVGWDPEKKAPLSKPRDRRMVLLTDLGFLVKDSLDGSHEVFVISRCVPLLLEGLELGFLQLNFACRAGICAHSSLAEGIATLASSSA